MTDDIAVCLAGKKLFGDDFSIEEIREWYEDEREGYTDLYVRPSAGRYHYEYTASDLYHAWRYVPNRRYRHALGIGSATGEEFLPLIDRISEVTILEPSRLYASWDNIGGVPTRWQPPEVTGDIPFPSGTFDLIACLSVLHHIPNVSHVLNECARVLTQDAVLIVREPVISMGDWRHPRPGLTVRERGIPRPLLLQFLDDAGLRVVHESLWNHPLLNAPLEIAGIETYNNWLTTCTDAILSRLLAWNYRYHRTSLFHKLAPRAIYLVVQVK